MHCAINTFTFSIPLNELIKLVCNDSEIPMLDNNVDASDSAFQPFISSNLFCNSPTISASSLEKFDLA